MQDTILRTELLAELNIWEMHNGIENGRGARFSLRTHLIRLGHPSHLLISDLPIKIL
jgi:hypothetical protein